MKLLDLSIVIPTYNRADKVSSLLLKLDEIFAGFNDINVEIIISDNHSKPVVTAPDSAFLNKVLKIVVPPEHLDTAEENLLFALNFARGTYTWVLGDDDMPLNEGVLQLRHLVLDANFDLMIFNSLGLDAKNEDWSVSRLQLDKFIEETDLKEFIRKVGFWSLPAGFSTLVLRTSSFNANFMAELHQQDLKIYSHVTTLLNSYHDKSFAAVAFPLVQYSSNSFDDESPTEVNKDAHWVNFGRRNQRFYRDPWTYSFLRQIDILEQSGIFTKRDLFLTFDQGHLGHRFVLFDTILAFVVDQLIYEKNFPLELKISGDEIEYILEFLRGVNGGIDELIGEIDSYLNREENSTDLLSLRANLLSEERQLNRRLILDFAGGKVLSTPFGYYWTPLKVNMNVNFKSHSSPALGLNSENLDGLDKMIREWKLRNSLLINLQDLESLNISGLNSLSSKFDKIFKKIPKLIRRAF
jgi:hypothetical protein